MSTVQSGGVAEDWFEDLVEIGLLAKGSMCESDLEKWINSVEALDHIWLANDAKETYVTIQHLFNLQVPHRGYFDNFSPKMWYRKSCISCADDSKLGGDAKYVSTAEEVVNSSKLILPGVGHFGAGMKRLNDSNLATPFVVQAMKTGSCLVSA